MGIQTNPSEIEMESWDELHGYNPNNHGQS